MGISVVKGSQNPHFKNRYADMNEVLEKIKKPLNDMGIVIIQEPNGDALITRLFDTESNTEVFGRLNFVGATDPQKVGSNITYCRRYSLIAMLGLEDEDDDAERASTKEELPTIRR